MELYFTSFWLSNKQRLLPTKCNNEGDDDSDDDDRFDDKTTAVTDDDYDDSEASFVRV